MASSTAAPGHPSPPQPAGAARRAPPPVCRRCLREFDPAANGPEACRYHPRQYVNRWHPEFMKNQPGDDRAYYQGVDLKGWRGSFWDCCAQEAPDAPGCKAARHITWDDPPGDVLEGDPITSRL
eukprot:TRINITY_DN32300_c0_g1_i2.p1 TRINITY_DN32300_c0_g1~~TRINITY_DN32300_c0_g1_i2.p1  ORF type:complete len:124 (+),score=28.47 TRINITY_DN32300_c0_g1_i2:78-449(+)